MIRNVYWNTYRRIQTDAIGSVRLNKGKGGKERQALQIQIMYKQIELDNKNMESLFCVGTAMSRMFHECT